MGLEDSLPQLLLATVNVCVQLVSVLADREFLIVINRDVDAARTYGLILRVVELRDKRMSQSLFCRQSSVRVELEELSQEVKRVVGGRRKNVSRSLRASGRQ